MRGTCRTHLQRLGLPLVEAPVGHAGGGIAVGVRQPQVRGTRVETYVALLWVRTEGDYSIVCSKGTRQSAVSTIDSAWRRPSFPIATVRPNPRASVHSGTLHLDSWSGSPQSGTYTERFVDSVARFYLACCFSCKAQRRRLLPSLVPHNCRPAASQQPLKPQLSLRLGLWHSPSVRCLAPSRNRLDVHQCGER